MTSQVSIDDIHKAYETSIRGLDALSGLCAGNDDRDSVMVSEIAVLLDPFIATLREQTDLLKGIAFKADLPRAGIKIEIRAE